jgi:hypothetical protein
MEKVYLMIRHLKNTFFLTCADARIFIFLSFKKI